MSPKSYPRGSLGRLWRRLRGGHASPARLAASVAIGLFVGSQPTFGLHLPLCALVCIPLRLDLLSAYLAAHISTPPLGALLLLCEIELGSLLVTGKPIGLSLEQVSKAGADGLLGFAFVGSVVIGATLAATGGALTRLAATRLRQRGGLADAMVLTMARYADLPRPLRRRALAGLEDDGLLRWLALRGEPLGRLVELGSTLGERGLCLLELGLARSLESISDAAGEPPLGAFPQSGAHFRRAPLERWSWGPADTLLLDPTLDRLDAERALAIIERALASVATGGRVLLSLRADAPNLSFAQRAVARMLGEATAQGASWPRVRALLEARGAPYEVELDPDAVLSPRLFVTAGGPPLTSAARPGSEP